MRLMKEYKTAFVTPSDEEIKEGIEMAKAENCVVRICYFVPYSGCYHLDIEPDSTFEQCYNLIHRL